VITRGFPWQYVAQDQTGRGVGRYPTQRWWRGVLSRSATPHVTLPAPQASWDPVAGGWVVVAGRR
jgi:hypothetical protein